MEGLFKALIDTGNLSMIIWGVVLLGGYKLLASWIDKRNNKSKSDAILEQNELFKSQFQIIANSLKTISDSLKLKDKIIDRINYRLGVIANQYGSDLSKDAATSVIQLAYQSFANSLANEIYELQKEQRSNNINHNHIKNKLSILTDETMQELDRFSYREKVLVTYTPNSIIEADKIIKIFNDYSSRNGMLRQEIENEALIEAQKVIKRL